MNTDTWTGAVPSVLRECPSEGLELYFPHESDRGSTSVLVYSGCYYRTPSTVWMKQHLFLMFLEGEKFSSWGEPIFWLADVCFLAVSSHHLCPVLLLGALILFMRALSSQPHYLSKDPLPNTFAMAIEFQTRILEEYKHSVHGEPLQGVDGGQGVFREEII